MSRERRAAVAGTFYPARREELERDVKGYLGKAQALAKPAKALIVPHAGYIYSGPVAGSGYRCLERDRAVVSRVVLIGPAHRIPLAGIAVSTADWFRTPLGAVAIDSEAVAALEALPGVVRSDAAHAPEHSLEVHVPFLQVVLDRFTLVPLLVGDANDDEVAAVLEAVWGGPETRVVVSTDLSHYQDYARARELDEETARAIEGLDVAPLHGRRACGYAAVRGLLTVARRRGLQIRRLDLRSSGDTAGPRDQVVGYGAWAVNEPSPLTAP